MDDHLRGKSELRSRKWRDGGEGQRGNHGWLVNRPTTVLLIPVAAVQPSRDLEHHHETSNGEGGCGGSPLTLVTTALAMSLSLTLPFWDAVRNIANARAWEHRSWAMITPIAWSITAREASDDRIWSVRAA